MKEVYAKQNALVIKGLMSRIHPSAVEQVRLSLQCTFVEMLKAHRKGVIELEELEVMETLDDNFGTW